MSDGERLREQLSRALSDLDYVRAMLASTETRLRDTLGECSTVRSQLLASGYLSSTGSLTEALEAALRDGERARARRSDMPVPEEDVEAFPEQLRPLVLAQRRRVGMASTVLDPLPGGRNSDAALILGALDASRGVFAGLAMGVELSEPARRAWGLVAQAQDRLRQRIRDRIPDDDPTE